MTTQHERLVRYTTLFIEKYGEIVSRNMKGELAEYRYNNDGTSTVFFHSNHGLYYSFDIHPDFRTLKIRLEVPQVDENSVYKSIASTLPFIKVDYTRIFEIFDFIKKDDEQLGSIKSFKRFNSMVSSLDESFNGMKIVYEIKYNDFYKKINKRVKVSSQINTELYFDNDMNFFIVYAIDIAFSDRDSIFIAFNSSDNSYSVDDQFMTKEQLLSYINSKRRSFIRKNIKRTFKTVDFDIDFDNKFQEQVQLLEMIHI